MNGKERKASSRLVRGLIVVVIGLIIWFSPVPTGVKKEAWHLLAIFVATIIGLILTPLPQGAMVIIGVMMTGFTQTLNVATVLSGFANSTVWLIVSAFLLTRAFIKTGLGRRIAYLFIRAFGRKTLGLSYAIAASDLVLAPATPSNTARSGGIIYPIVRGMASTFGSEPGESAKKIGSFLMMAEYQVVVITTSMFMTAGAANPLLIELAKKTANISVSWGMWALAGIVPGLLSLILVPFILYKIYPPEIKATPEASELANRELEKMGPMKKSEKTLLVVFLVILTLWVTSELNNLDATVVAFDRRGNHDSHRGPQLGRCPGRKGGLGCPDLVRGIGHDGHRIEPARAHEVDNGCRWKQRGGFRLATGADHHSDILFLLPLWLRQLLRSRIGHVHSSPDRGPGR